MILGDPAGVEAGADELAAAGTALLDVAEAVAAHGRATTADWQGDASDAARDACDVIAARTAAGADAVSAAAPVLQTYADELRAAQQAWGDAAHAIGVATRRQRAVEALVRRSASDPDGVAARNDLKLAGENLEAGRSAMASAEQRAARANETAAVAINRLTGDLSAMTLQASLAPCPAPPPQSPERHDSGFSLGAVVHGVLDGAGMVPVAGEIFDVINGVIYTAEGDYVNASFSYGSAVPVVGNFVMTAKYAKKGVEVIKAAEAAEAAADAAQAANAARVAGTSTDEAAGLLVRTPPRKTPSLAQPPSAGPPGRLFITTPRGATFDVPAGWPSRVTDNGRGIVFQPPGATGKNDLSIRIMEPTRQYPSGYFRYYNQRGQPLNAMGKPGSMADASVDVNGTHFPEDYRGPLKDWPGQSGKQK